MHHKKKATRVKVRTFVRQLVSTPDLDKQLDIVHDLALYESAEALLGPEQKAALYTVRQLAVKWRKIGRKGRKWLRERL